MSILFCSPMFGGQCTSEYFLSCMNTHEELLKSGIPHDWFVNQNESLVQRARNTMASAFLRTGHTHLFFIDADIQFTPEDVSKIWNLQVPIAVGVYPMKKIGAGYAAWIKGKLVKSLDQFANPISVDYAGTGFMLIERNVFEKMIVKYPAMAHKEGENKDDCWAFFNPHVWEGAYLPEDYSFCKRWRDMGGEVTMDPSVRLKHVGRYIYG